MKVHKCNTCTYSQCPNIGKIQEIKAKTLSYNKSLFKTSEMKYFVKRFNKALPNNVSHLISRGYSGCAIASAMVATHERELTHQAVRKEHDLSHSARFAGHDHEQLALCKKKRMFTDPVAIVDDFISSGKTIRTVIRQLLDCVYFKPEKIYILVGSIGEYNCPIKETQFWSRELNEEYKMPIEVRIIHEVLLFEQEILDLISEYGAPEFNSTKRSHDHGNTD